jgi:NAD(P)H-hydrate epimerase
MLVTVDAMRALEAAALAGGLTEDSLMEEAGRGLAEAVMAILPRPAAVVVFAGKGHNAGDALVAARHWIDADWPVVVEAASPEAEWRPLLREKWRLVDGRLTAAVPASGRLILVDALLGLGSGRGLRPPVLDACRRINALRRVRHAAVVAVDGPTGLDFDTGEADEDAVRADMTVTVAAVKRGLLAEPAVDWVGRLAVAPVAALEPRSAAVGEKDDEVLTPNLLRPRLPAPRPFDFHKGQAGRILVVAGSRGFMGAAQLCSSAAVHGGAGLVTLAVPVSVWDVAAGRVCPEVMVRGYREWSELEDIPADVLAVGPGLGRRDDEGLAAWLARETRPTVIDADALNALASVGAAGDQGLAGLARAALARPGRLLTPHPGEMRRLLSTWHPSLLEASRADQARGASDAWGCAVVLKGARSLIAAPGHPLAHNTTGHPGMASGGMGDVLTGLCAALMAQGCSAREAGCLGSWLLGRAAESALAQEIACPESLRASVVLNALGRAFDALRSGDT